MSVSLGLVVTVVVTAFGASFQFYSTAAVNTPQSVVEAWINETYFARGFILSQSTLTFMWSLFVGIICVGALCGSMATPFFAENIGRRNGLILNGFINVIGGTLEALAKSFASPEVLFIGRIILGFNVGLASGLAPMYLTEIAPISQRGAAGTAHQIASAFADWISLFLTLPFILGGVNLWPIAFGFPALPALVLVLVLPFSYESPRYLIISKGDREKAINAVHFFSSGANAKQTIDSLTRECALTQRNLQIKGKARITDMFRKKSLRTPLFISIFVMIAQQFTGCAAIFAYSTDVFIQANLSIETARMCTLVVGICYFLCTLPAAFFIEKAGRRKLSLIQLSGCLITMIMTTIFTVLLNRFNYGWASYGCIASLVLYMCIYGFGSPVPWLIASELFTQEYRSMAVMFGTFTAWLGAFIVSFGYLPFQRAVSVEFSFLPFIVVMSISIIVMYLLLPETKNKSIEEIVNEFRENKRTISRRMTLRKYSSASQEAELEALLGSHHKYSNGYSNGYS